MLRYLAEGSLSQHLEQLELGGVGLLRALLDHVGDVDLLDVSIFLQKQGEETDQSDLAVGVGFCFFLLIAIWCSTGNLKDREPLSQSLSDFKLHFCQEKKGGSAVREREKKKSVRDDTPLCLSVCFEKASQQNYGSKRLTAAIKNNNQVAHCCCRGCAFSTKGSCSASRSAETCQAGSSAGRNPA